MSSLVVLGFDDQLAAEFDRDVGVRVGFIETQVSDGRTGERQPERLVSRGISR